MNSLNRIVALCVFAGLAAPAQAGDLLDTRLSFVFADDNVFAGPGDTTPNSPLPGFGANNQNTLFFENYNSAYSGFESLSHLVMYAKAPAFFEGLQTEAALAVLLAQTRSGELRLRDDSSYIRLGWRPQGWGEKENLELIGFPVSANRFRLGYLYRLTWGGDTVYGTRGYKNGIPGAKLQLNRDRWYVFAGAKTAVLLDDVITEENTVYGGLVGGGWDALDILRIEVGGGAFQKGKIPGLAKQGVDADVTALGASARISLHVREPVSQSVDLKLYRNDPDLEQKVFAPLTYAGGLSYNVSVEASHLVQTLSDPDVFGKTVPQSADALAMQARVTYNYARFTVLGVYRTMSHILFDVPGFPPYTDLPNGTTTNPEMFAAVGADYHFPSIHLTPGVVFGVQQAASMTSPVSLCGGNNPGDGFDCAGRTVVVRTPGDFSVLPRGQSPLPILSAKTSTRWDISQAVAALGELYYTRDPNRATFIKGLDGTTVQEFEKEDRLGFNLIVQARF